MRYFAFLRNVTLGRGGLSKAALLEAFLRAGAKDPQSFLASGNLVFEAPGAEGEGLLERAARRLADRHGFTEPIYLRSLGELQDLVARNPFADAPTDHVYERCLSFLLAPLALDLPLVSARKDVEVFAAAGLEVFSVTRRVGGRSGYATALLEARYGVRVTTRNWNTVLRLIRRYG